MMYGGDAQHQQRQPPQGQQPPPHLQPPLPPGPPPPYAQLQQQQPPPGMEFQRGPPPQMQMNRQPSAPSTANFPHHPPPYEAHADSYAAKRMRKLTQRRAVDYTSTIVRYIQARMWQRDSRDRTSLQPIPAAVVDLLPAAAYSDNPSTSFAAKFVHTSINKVRCPIYRVLWTPNGRRLITGSQSGEFTLWNGQSFNFEMIIQAHDNAISSMVWSHNGNWMVSGDNGGSIKYWQTNMNNVKVNKSAHKESIRDLSFCRTDLKFCSCSDDTTVKVWDFAKCQEESSLTGHGWDVKCVDWHPSKSLLVSGGKDNLVKLWDAKSGKELCSFHGHKNTVLSAKWNDNGNWVLTASKDQVIKLYDIRAMKELESFRGHCKDVTALAWHPFHEDYFVSGSFDGSIFHWIVGHETPQIEMPSAHETAVWDLSWHPVGYLLCSGSNDHTTKFWCRNRPGDINRDKFNGGYNQGYGEQNSAFANRIAMNFPMPDGPTTPGSFPPGLARNEGTIPGVGAAMPLNFSSLDTSSEQKQGSMPLGAPPLPPGPHPSLLSAGQNPVYQQNSQQIPQQSVPQQMPPFPMPPHNMQQLQPPSHMNVLQNPHLPRPLQQMPPHGMPGSMGGQPSMQSLPPMPGTMGGPNQMGPPQGHYMGASAGGGFPNGMSNMQSNSGGAMYPPHGGYNRPQAGQMPMMPGLNPYQPGNPNAMPQPPLPPGPPPQQTQQ